MPIFLSICMSLCASAYLSVCLHISLSVCISLYVSAYLSVCLHIFLSVCISLCVSAYISLCVCICISLCASAYLCVCVCVLVSYFHLCLSYSLLDRQRCSSHTFLQCSSQSHDCLSIYLKYWWICSSPSCHTKIDFFNHCYSVVALITHTPLLIAREEADSLSQQPITMYYNMAHLWVSR